MTLIDAPLTPPMHQAPRSSPADRASEPLNATTVWRLTWALYAVTVALVTALYWETPASIVRIWWNVTTYGHGFLVVPISAYLLWRERSDLGLLTPRPQPLGLLLITGAALVWLLAFVTDVQLIAGAAFVGLLQSLFLTLFGWRVTRQALFPVLFLAFGVPFGNFLIPPLQDFTAAFCVQLLQWTGVPVYLDGIMLHIPSGSFVVKEACAGLRFLISTVALGFLGAYLFYRQWWRRFLFVALAFAVPIIANGFRAYGIVMIAHLSNFEYAVGADHLIYGWVFLSFVTLALIGLGLTFRDRYDAIPELRATRTPADEAGGWADALRKRAGIAALAVALAAVAPAYAAWTNAAAHHTPGPEIVIAPRVTGPWARLETGRITWSPSFRGADQEMLVTYTDDGTPVYLSIAYYAWQRSGAEIVNELNQLADGERWRRIGGGTAIMRLDGVTQDVKETRLSDGRDTLIAWSWYWVDGRFTSSPLQAKLYQTRARLLGGPQAAAALAIATPESDDPSAARATLARFATSLSRLNETLSSAERGAGTGTTEP